MSKGTSQKLKILFLMKILLEKTDEEHALTLNEIITELEHYQITAERKSLYEDLDTLRTYGLDINTCKTKTTRYYIANRVFELPELKLLVDVVQCSKAITHNKSNKLIKKLESLTSIHLAGELHRQVYVSDRVKTINENIYYNVDKLHTAIADEKQVSFRYFDYNLNREKTFRKNDHTYYTSPYGLCWSEDNYYLVAYSEKYDNYEHYRVDRMSTIKIMDKKRVHLPKNKKFNIADYSQKVFNMYAGEEECLKLKVDNSLVNAMLERYGKSIYPKKLDEESFIIQINVAVSTPFFAWLSRYGNKVKIIEPEKVVRKFKVHLQEILEQY